MKKKVSLNVIEKIVKQGLNTKIVAPESNLIKLLNMYSKK